MPADLNKVVVSRLDPLPPFPPTFSFLLFLLPPLFFFSYFSSSSFQALELHRQSIAQALKHHSHQIHVSYEAARRENLRDVWIQKGRKADTLLITVTATSTLFLDHFSHLSGYIPPHTCCVLWVLWSFPFCCCCCSLRRRRSTHWRLLGG